MAQSNADNDKTNAPIDTDELTDQDKQIIEYLISVGVKDAK